MRQNAINELMGMVKAEAQSEFLMIIKTQSNVRIPLGGDQIETVGYHSLDYALDRLKIPIVW